jgi:dienelactone hydrolase
VPLVALAREAALMPGANARKFALHFARAAPAPREAEVLVEVAGEPRPASVYSPATLSPDAPAWVMLHGVTVPGRHHVAARRLARALAAVGHTSILPEVPPWTALEVSPDHTEPAISAGLEYLRGRLGIRPERIGLMGFSVAGTWALEAAAGPFRDDVRAVLAAGAYADLERTLLAMVTGTYEWRGHRGVLPPDPYGRWIVGATLLPLIEGDRWGDAEARQHAAAALRALAWTAGRNGARADEPIYDPLSADLRATLPAAAHPAWDVLAPPSARIVPEEGAARALVHDLAEAGLRAMPRLSPAGLVEQLRTETRAILLHGRADRLIPYTETLALAELLGEARPHVTVTGLIGHTKRSEAGPIRSPVRAGREVWTFLRFAERLVTALDD